MGNTILCLAAMLYLRTKANQDNWFSSGMLQDIVDALDLVRKFGMIVCVLSWYHGQIFNMHRQRPFRPYLCTLTQCGFVTYQSVSF